MEVKAIKMNKFSNKQNDIYTNVVIAAKRSRQIIDSRALDFESIDNVEDSFELEEMENNQVQRLVDYLDVVKTPHAGAAERTKLQKDFKTFYSQYDIRRGKEFEKTFPIIGEWYRGI